MMATRRLDTMVEFQRLVEALLEAFWLESLDDQRPKNDIDISQKALNCPN